MNYNKIKELEIQYESLGLKIKTLTESDEIANLERRRLDIIEELRALRRLQYESQFVINVDDYEY